MKLVKLYHLPEFLSRRVAIPGDLCYNVMRIFTEREMPVDTVQRAPADKRLRRELIGRINLGRWALLAIVAVSLLNQLLLACGVKYHFLFSAAMPYYLNWLGIELGAVASVGAYRALAVVLTIGLYAAYAACWLLSAQQKEWLLASLVLYGVDTLLLAVFALTLWENPASCLLEILTHCVGLFALYVALQASEKLSQLPRIRRRVEETDG